MAGSIINHLAITAPKINWEAISAGSALVIGTCLVLVLGLFKRPSIQLIATFFVSLLTLLTTIGLAIWRWNDNTRVIKNALVIDNLTLTLTIIFCIGGIAALLLSVRSQAARESGHGEHYALILSSILGMIVLVATNNLVTLFVGLELLSIPLYVLCATELKRTRSLESGLKYLIVGSVGSATLLYGLALIYGSSGQTDFNAIAEALPQLSNDVLFFTGIALAIVGLAFKASIAPFHQWTPDVYEGAPTPITAFMAVATKAAAFGVFIRLFDVALVDSANDWAPALAVLAAITIIVGNVGAIGQTSLKRMLAYSGVAQAGYMLAGVVVSTQLGIQATVFYLAIYMLMNLGAFAVIIARERETPLGDDMAAFYGLGSNRPWLAWPMTISMLALAGMPLTAGFFGKIYLIEATVDNGYSWLGVMIVIGSILSLAYYLRVISVMWMRPKFSAERNGPTRLLGPVIAGGSQWADDIGDSNESDDENQPQQPVDRPRDQSGSPLDKTPTGSDKVGGGAGGTSEKNGDEVFVDSENGEIADRRLPQPEVAIVTIACAIATIFFGIFPQPLFDVAQDAGQAILNLL